MTTRRSVSPSPHRPFAMPVAMLSGKSLFHGWHACMHAKCVSGMILCRDRRWARLALQLQHPMCEAPLYARQTIRVPGAAPRMRTQLSNRLLPGGTNHRVFCQPHTSSSPDAAESCPISPLRRCGRTQARLRRQVWRVPITRGAAILVSFLA